MSSKSTRLTLSAATLAIVLALALPASSMPRLMDLYNAHPKSLAQNREKCVICHTNQDGSGKLTAFGHKYEQTGLEFTAALVKEYPNLFDVNSAAVNSRPASSYLWPKAESLPDPSALVWQITHFSRFCASDFGCAL